MRLPKSALRIVLALIGCLGSAGCVPFGAGGSSAAGTAPTATLPFSVSPTPAPTPTLGPLPMQCPISPPSSRAVFSQLSPVIGAAPVWATWPTSPNRFNPTSPPPYPSNYEAPYGWQAGKIVWEVGPKYVGLVTVHGADLYDHTPLYVQPGNDPPTTVTVLAPQHPDHPQSALGADWAEWGSYLIIPKAGCYHLEVSWPAAGSWPAGHWEITFAEGA